MITYHKLDTGEWVAQGPASELKIGEVDIMKRGGKVCHRVVDEVVPADNKHFVWGYLTEHCKAESEAAMWKRKGKHCSACGSNEPHHLEYVQKHGVCVV